MAHGERGSPLDAGRAVANHPIEFRAQLPDHARHPFLGQRILVAGLRGGKQEQRLDALVADESLRKLGSALHDIDEVVDHTPFGPHDQVEVAQPHVEIDHHDLLAGAGQPRTQRGGRRRLADAALAGRHYYDLPHRRPPLGFQSTAATRIVSPSSHA